MSGRRLDRAFQGRIRLRKGFLEQVQSQAVDDDTARKIHSGNQDG